MFTNKKLNAHITSFIQEIKDNNIHVSKAVLFGSYAKGKPTANSDIDLAIWAEEFEGCNLTDIVGIEKIISKYHPIQLKCFNSKDNKFTNPFIEVIEATGLQIV